MTIEPTTAVRDPCTPIGSAISIAARAELTRASLVTAELARSARPRCAARTGRTAVDGNFLPSRPARAGARPCDRAVPTCDQCGVQRCHSDEIVSHRAGALSHDCRIVDGNPALQPSVVGWVHRDVVERISVPDASDR
jgi:hypothetical protein